LNNPEYDEEKQMAIIDNMLNIPFIPSDFPRIYAIDRQIWRKSPQLGLEMLNHTIKHIFYSISWNQRFDYRSTPEINDNLAHIFIEIMYLVGQLKTAEEALAGQGRSLEGLLEEYIKASDQGDMQAQKSRGKIDFITLGLILFHPFYAKALFKNNLIVDALVKDMDDVFSQNFSDKSFEKLRSRTDQVWVREAVSLWRDSPTGRFFPLPSPLRDDLLQEIQDFLESHGYQLLRSLQDKTKGAVIEYGKRYQSVLREHMPFLVQKNFQSYFDFNKGDIIKFNLNDGSEIFGRVAGIDRGSYEKKYYLVGLNSADEIHLYTSQNIGKENLNGYIIEENKKEENKDLYGEPLKFIYEPLAIKSIEAFHINTGTFSYPDLAMTGDMAMKEGEVGFELDSEIDLPYTENRERFMEFLDFGTMVSQGFDFNSSTNSRFLNATELVDNFKENLEKTNRELKGIGTPLRWLNEWNEFLPAASYLLFGEKLGEYDFVKELDETRNDKNTTANIRNTINAFSAIQNVSGIANVEKRKFTFRELLVRYYSRLKRQQSIADTLSSAYNIEALPVEINMDAQFLKRVLRIVLGKIPDAARAGEREASLGDGAMRAEDIYDFSTNRFKIKELEQMFKSINPHAVIVGSARYLPSDANDIDVTLQDGSEDSVNFFSSTLTYLLNGLQGVHAENQYITYTYRRLELDVVASNGSKHKFGIDIIRGGPLYAVAFIGKMLHDLYSPGDNETLLKAYFQAEYYWGDEQIYKSMLQVYQHTGLQWFIGLDEFKKRVDYLRRALLSMDPTVQLNHVLDKIKKSAAGDPAMLGLPRDLAKIKLNRAMLPVKSGKSNLGGIDLTSDKALSVQNNGQGIKFHLDPAQLQELENAPGFVPVIINIQPLGDLKMFLQNK